MVRINTLILRVKILIIITILTVTLTRVGWVGEFQLRQVLGTISIRILIAYNEGSILGVTIIISITISLHGNYIIIMPTLIALSQTIWPKSNLTFNNIFTLPFISCYLTFTQIQVFRHRIIQGSGLGVGWELVLSQHDAKLSEQLKVFCLCFRPTLHPDSGLPRLSYSGTR